MDILSRCCGPWTLSELLDIADAISRSFGTLIPYQFQCLGSSSCRTWFQLSTCSALAMLSGLRWRCLCRLQCPGSRLLSGQQQQPEEAVPYPPTGTVDEFPLCHAKSSELLLSVRCNMEHICPPLADEPLTSRKALAPTETTQSVRIRTSNLMAETSSNLRNP